VGTVTTYGTAGTMRYDLVNVFGIQNVLGLTYAPNPADPTQSPVKEEYQLGFLPLFYYKIDF
jgi:hypothetical protein